MEQKPNPNFALAVLSSCYFILAVASLSVIGVLVPMADGLGVSESEVAYLVAVFSITNAVAAPLLQTVVGDWDRRRLIVVGLGFMALGTGITAVAQTYDIAVIGRMVLAVGAGVVGPVASVTGAALVDVSERGSALGKVFAGMTVATVLGVPLTALGGDVVGWRGTLFAIAVLAVVIAFAVWVVVPETARGQRAKVRDIWVILSDRILVSALGVTAFQMAGQLATYAVIAVYLVAWLDTPPAWLPFALMSFGVGGICGNIFAMRMVDRVGPEILMLSSLLGTGAVFVCLQIAPSIAWLAFPLMGAWAAASMILFAPQQARLIGMRPEAANLLLALNGSAIYGGMAVGSAVGGYVYATAGAGWLAPTSAGFVVLALCAFLLSRR